MNDAVDTKKSARPASAPPSIRVVRAALIAFALLLPMLAGLATALVERERADASAQALAWLARHESLANATTVPSELAKVLRQLNGDADAEVRVLLSVGAAPIVLQGNPDGLMGPTIVAQRNMAPGHEIAVSRSLSGALLAAALALVLSCGLALVLWRLALSRPVGALRRAQGRLRTIARRDALTGLHNREGLRLCLEHALERTLENRRTVGVLLIDLDRFRLINDSLGQPVGDQLLCGVADRIRAVTRAGDLVARLGSDQFAVLVEGLAGAQAASAMARNLLRAFEPAYVLNGRDTIATLSIGVAIGGEHADSVDGVLRCAEAALRAAKSDGGGRFRVFESEMNVDTEHLLDMDLRLRRALQADEFFLVYQPIADIRAGRIVGVEALIRWKDPQRGVVSPADFIPVLEQTGLIVRAGHWVLEQALIQAGRWQAAGTSNLVMSVNVSPRQFAEPDFVESLTAVLQTSRFPARQLQLEVTEGLLLEPSDATITKLDALAALGIRIAVDDFGMGYSSLAYLKRFRLHSLKIDRMFLNGIPLEPRDAAILRAIIDLGHGLGLHVTAEGVETAEQFHELRRLGCDSAQGFLLARPMVGEKMSALLAQTEGAEPWSETSTGVLGAPIRELAEA